MGNGNGAVPSPLVPPDVDLRDMDCFMLNVERLLSSELWAVSTGDEFKAAVGLWARAWKQIPASSLPDDERVMASFAGVTVPKWRKVRAVAMRGFILCSDGRFYHQVLAEDALRAWEKKLSREANRQAGRERLKRWREAKRNKSETRYETVDETITKREGNDDVTSRTVQRQIPPKAPPCEKSDLGEDFEGWWFEVPRKEGKGQAERAYRAARKTASREILLDGIRRYAAERRGEDPKFTRQPATWLNGKCWLDEKSAALNGPVMPGRFAL